MKRLEVIHLRLVDPHSEALIQKIRDSLPLDDPNITIRIYQHATVETDVAVHIHMGDPSTNPDVAELGVRIATALREYGMVEYSIWIEQKVDAKK